jgi:hypothetical protein
MRNLKGQFTNGIEKRQIVGTVRIRTNYKRGGVKRAWVKTAEPNTWRLRAVVNWELENGPVPIGKVLHHKDRNKLNDAVCNLEPKSRAEHIAEHRSEFSKAGITALIKARKSRRWSTKTKVPGRITGRHKKNCKCPIHA